MLRLLCLLGTTIGAIADQPAVEDELLEPRLVHLRGGSVREWSEFPEKAESSRLELSFQCQRNAGEWALAVRQDDVKQLWSVSLNGRRIGELTRDENEMVVVFAVPAGTLVDGRNLLTVEARSPRPDVGDDIRIGQIRLRRQAVQDYLGEALLEIQVTDATSQPLPCRVTIVDGDGALQSLGNRSDTEMAVRPGIAYLAHGRGQLRLPAGRYTVFAGRGFEYSLARREVALVAGETARVTMPLEREVPSDGLVACDTHVHTLTYSGHGDATIEERMITVAGEGIELPIATDHNRHIDYETVAQRLGVRRHFTPVVGNEVTTGNGHFNIFPVAPDSPPPDHRLTEWSTVFRDIAGKTKARVAILNHARDLHGGTRPFGPKLFNAVVAEHQEEWPALLNAMEVVNSGATQSDVLRLFHDWMALLNRGRMITPVGSSDSHDVGRHFVGQARTYIRCDDGDPGHIDVDSAVASFLRGEVMVSYGLLTRITVNGKYGPGELAQAEGDAWDVSVQVLGPHWVQANRLLLFANGRLLREVEVPQAANAKSPGLKFQLDWRLPKLSHDAHLVAIALGPGIDGFFWPTAKSYQPMSPQWEAHVIGCSGAVWVDGDGDTRRTAPREYAERLFGQSNPTIDDLVQALQPYDEAVAAHAAFLFQRASGSLTADHVRQALQKATPATAAGFQAYLTMQRECELARAAAIP
jgi:hypothetical protein